jgi:capsular exopolysaccharide synthesis family protein
MREELRGQISALAAAGQQDTEAYDELTSREQQLTAIEALESARAVVVQRAERVDKVGPQPLRNAALGLGVGDFVNLEHEARSVVITSSVSQEGKSVVAANLAVTLARAGRRVVLCDLDVRQPSIARLFGLLDRPGLTEVVLGVAPLDQALASIDVGIDEQAERAGENGRLPMLRVLTVGRAQPPNPGEFVASGRVAALIKELESQADHVILDTPPILPLGDAAALSANADGVLFVARLETLKRPMLTAAKRPLAASPAELLGVVITNAESGGDYAYDYIASARRPTSAEPRSSRTST